MRATISFEADVSRVNDIMRSLVLEESNALQEALMSLEKATTDRIAEGISEALGHIYSVTKQLEQYRDMVASFERARFETILPQEADTRPLLQTMGEVKEAAQVLRKFDSFLDQIGEEDPDGTAVEEG
jgi:signal recognition particle GTPase